MDIQSAFYSGMQGFARASEGVTQATLEINRQTRPQSDTEQAVAQTAEAAATNPAATNTASSVQAPSLTNSLVQLGQEERNAQANVRSIQTADQVLGSVIDIRV